MQESDVQAVRGMGENIRAMKADGQFDTAAFKSAVAEMEARKAELTPALEAEIARRLAEGATEQDIAPLMHALPNAPRKKIEKEMRRQRKAAAAGGGKQQGGKQQGGKKAASDGSGAAPPVPIPAEARFLLADECSNSMVCYLMAAADDVSEFVATNVAHGETHVQALCAADPDVFMSRLGRCVCDREMELRPTQLVHRTKRKPPRTHMLGEQKEARRNNTPKDPARLAHILALAADAREVLGERRAQRRGARAGRTAAHERANEAMARANPLAGDTAALDALLAEDGTMVPQEWQDRYKTEGARYWDHFYQEKTVNFFKDRQYMRKEFPEIFPESVRQNPAAWCAELEPAPEGATDGTPGLLPLEVLDTRPDPVALAEAFAEKRVVLEVGCAVGNAAFPMLRASPDMVVVACDLSAIAVELLRSKPEYRARRCFAFTCDITDVSDGAYNGRVASFASGGAAASGPAGSKVPWWCAHAPLRQVLPAASVDFLTIIFVLSAVAPAMFGAVAANAFHTLKPGGMVLFRDYGRYDLAQLRLGKGRKLEEHCYVRGDGTLTYFFEEAQLSAIFEAAGFETVECEVRMREINNAKRGLDMNRIWIQGKFRKPV